MNKQARLEKHINRLTSQFNYNLEVLQEYYRNKGLQFMLSYDNIDREYPYYYKLRVRTQKLSHKLNQLKHKL